MSSLISHENLQHAINLVFFEQWLRFYFIVEDGGKLYLRMPEAELEQARNLHPELVPVAEALNNREIDHQAAMEALCEGMMNGPYALDGAQWAEILAGQHFRLMLELLSFWVQSGTDKADEPLPFHDWKNRFDSWRENPNIKSYSARVISGDMDTDRIQ